MKKYNFLFITSDQQHYDTIGKFNPKIKTPNLDRLCNRGTYFDRAYTVNPTCTPTRASMITGKYPSQHGAWTLGTKLSEECETIGDILHTNGYKTALVGKAHFQPIASNEKYKSLESDPILWDFNYWKNFNESFYGFDTVRLARNHTYQYLVGQHYAIWLEENECKNWRDYFQKPTGVMDKPEAKWEIPEKYHYDAWIAEETNKLLEEYKNSEENFMLWASFFDPHPPYMLPEPWYSMYDDIDIDVPDLDEGEMETATEIHRLTQERNPDFSKYTGEFAAHGCHSQLNSRKNSAKNIRYYYGMVSLMDKYIGKIIDKIDELGLTENTIIVFTTDHGNFMGQHGLYGKGAFMYEDAIKVPMIVSCKDLIPQNNVSHAMQSIVDIPVTILKYLNCKVPYDWTGLDQREAWENKDKSVRDHIICEMHHERNKINLRAYVDERYKLVVYYNDMYGELYDLKNDPREVKNLWNDRNSADLKNKLIMKYIFAELQKESLFMPRIAGA